MVQGQGSRAAARRSPPGFKEKNDNEQRMEKELRGVLWSLALDIFKTHLGKALSNLIRFLKPVLLWPGGWTRALQIPSWMKLLHESRVKGVWCALNSESASQLLLSWEMRWACLPTEAPVSLSTCFYKRLKCHCLISNKIVSLSSFIGIHLPSATYTICQARCCTVCTGKADVSLADKHLLCFLPRNGSF